MTNRKPRHHYRPYSEDEIEVLTNELGYMYYPEIAKRLCRTEKSVREKARRLGVGLYSNIWTNSMVARELGVSRWTVRKWIREGMLKAEKASWRCKNGRGHVYPVLIRENDIEDFIKRHGGEVMRLLRKKGVHRIPNKYFHNLLA